MNEMACASGASGGWAGLPWQNGGLDLLLQRSWPAQWAEGVKEEMCILPRDMCLSTSEVMWLHPFYYSLGEKYDQTGFGV